MNLIESHCHWISTSFNRHQINSNSLTNLMSTGPVGCPAQSAFPPTNSQMGHIFCSGEGSFLANKGIRNEVLIPSLWAHKLPHHSSKVDRKWTPPGSRLFKVDLKSNIYNYINPLTFLTFLHVHVFHRFFNIDFEQSALKAHLHTKATCIKLRSCFDGPMDPESTSVISLLWTNMFSFFPHIPRK